MQERLAEQGQASIVARREFEAMVTRVKAADARMTALQQDLDAAQRSADEEHARADQQAKLREQLEVAGHESLQRAVSDLSAKYESKLLESKQRVDLITKRFEAVQKELAETRARLDREAVQRAQADTATGEKHEATLADAKKRADAATAKANALQRELDRTLASLSDEHARADREAKLRGQLEAAARATLHRTADVSSGHQREAAVAREAARLAEEQVAAVVLELEQLRCC